MSSVLIPAEVVENEQEHITSSSKKVGSITPYIYHFINSLRKETIIMSKCSILLKL